MSELDKLSVRQEVIHKLAVGEPQTGIAKRLGVNQSTISRFKEKNEERIEKARHEIIAENIDGIQEGIKNDIENNKKLSIEFKESSNITSEKVAYKSSVQKNIIKPLLEKVGIYPSNTIHIGDDNSQNITISPAFQDYIDFQNSRNDGEEQEEIKV